MTEKALAKRRRGRPPIHGLYSKVALVDLTADKRNMILDLIEGERIPCGKPDMAAVELLARCLCKIELIDRYFAEHGLFEDPTKGTAKSIWKPYQAMMNTAVRLCNDLGLTPTARATLSKHVAEALTDFAQAVQEAAKQKEEENGKTSGADAPASS